MFPKKILQEVKVMLLEKILEKYPFGEVEAAVLLDQVLSTAEVLGKDATRNVLISGARFNRILQVENNYPITVENIADLAERIAPLAKDYTFQGAMNIIFPVLGPRRPCLVGNHKHWFLRWQTRKWVCDPSPMIGGSPGGQCEVTMAIVEDQETGQVAEVYPREVRFLDSVPVTKPEGDAKDVPGMPDGILQSAT